jgi:hypothetical protein
VVVDDLQVVRALGDTSGDERVCLLRAAESGDRNPVLGAVSARGCRERAGAAEIGHAREPTLGLEGARGSQTPRGAEEVDLERDPERERESESAGLHARMRVRVEKARKEGVSTTVDATRRHVDLRRDADDALAFDEDVRLEEALAVEDGRTVEEPRAIGAARLTRGGTGRAAATRERQQSPRPQPVEHPRHWPTPSA